MTHVHRDKIVISIHPPLVEAIFAKRKRFEFRRRTVPDTVRTLFIYTTKPVCRVVGCVRVVKIHTGTRGWIVDMTAGRTSDDPLDVWHYLAGAANPTAIQLGAMRRFRKPLTLRSLGVHSAPQSWCYLPRR